MQRLLFCAYRLARVKQSSLLPSVDGCPGHNSPRFSGRLRRNSVSQGWRCCCRHGWLRGGVQTRRPPLLQWMTSAYRSGSAPEWQRGFTSPMGRRPTGSAGPNALILTISLQRGLAGTGPQRRSQSNLGQVQSPSGVRMHSHTVSMHRYVHSFVFFYYLVGRLESRGRCATSCATASRNRPRGTAIGTLPPGSNPGPSKIHET